MENFMLKVPCGISGRVRVVRENQQTGEVTGEFEFDNIWTDLGLSEISVYSSQTAEWPTRLLYGNGVRSEPHSAVTTLASQVGYGNAGFILAGGVDYDEDLCTVTRTSQTTVGARGVAWNLSELGLGYNSTTATWTYTLTKNALGNPEVIPVSAIEILTIYYTIQVQYPMHLPPMTVDVVGLPPTTATFALRPDKINFATYAIGAKQSYYFGYTSAEFAGGVVSAISGNKNVWGIGKLNRTTGFFGSNYNAAHHIWTLNPPITKNNTQELELEIYWRFTNATPIDVG
jgi:hypothetical protein